MKKLLAYLLLIAPLSGFAVDPSVDTFQADRILVQAPNSLALSNSQPCTVPASLEAAKGKSDLIAKLHMSKTVINGKVYMGCYIETEDGAIFGVDEDGDGFGPFDVDSFLKVVKG